MGMGVSGGEEGARNGELRRCRGRCYACFFACPQYPLVCEETLTLYWHWHLSSTASTGCVQAPP